MILLLMLIGAFVVYMLFFMAVIVGLMAFSLSFLVYGLVYVGSYMWGALRHRGSPEWKFEKRPWVPDTSRMEEYSVVAGIMSMVAMVAGFLAYALSDGDWVTTIGIASAVIPLGWLVLKADTEEPGVGPEKGKTFDRNKFSS